MRIKMNATKANSQSNNNIRAVTDRATVKPTPCGFPGCDGSWHESHLTPSEWSHHADTQFDDDSVTVALIRTGQAAPVAQVWMEGIHEDMTADDLRSLADTYEGLPTLMRAQADALDALTDGL